MTTTGTDQNSTAQPRTGHAILRIIIAALLGTIVVLVLAALLNYAPRDWIVVWKPAIIEFVNGKTPYSVYHYHFPPWALIPLIPLAALPDSIGGLLMALVSIACYGYAAIRLGARPWLALLIMLSPPVLRIFHNPNIEGLVALGLVLPPQIGLFFVLIKPQTGAIVGLFWLVETWRKGGIKEAARVFAPVTIALLISFVVYGLWFKHGMAIAPDYPWNLSAWPVSIPVGLVLVVSALRSRKLGTAITASPFFAPYLSYYSLGVPVLGLLPRTAETLAAVAGLWIFYLMSGW